MGVRITHPSPPEAPALKLPAVLPRPPPPPDPIVPVVGEDGELPPPFPPTASQLAPPLPPPEFISNRDHNSSLVVETDNNELMLMVFMSVNSVTGNT